MKGEIRNPLMKHIDNRSGIRIFLSQYYAAIGKSNSAPLLLFNCTGFKSLVLRVITQPTERLLHLSLNKDLIIGEASNILSRFTYTDY